MNKSELLAILNNPDSTEEQKQAALDVYSEEKETAEESVVKLTAKNSEILQEKKAATQQAAEAKKEVDEVLKKNMSARQVEEHLNNQHQEELARLKEEHEAEVKMYLGQLEKVEVQGKAIEIAAELCEKPQAILPHLMPFFGYEVNENGFETFFKDADGKRTAMKREELIEMVKGIDYLKPFLKSDFTNKGTVTTRTEGKTESQNPAVQNYLSAMNQ